jgi:mono/diheme cytochrome c family protein
MKRLLTVLTVGTLLGIGLLGVFPGESAVPVQGKALYEAKCQICHGPRGDGKGPAAASFNPRPPDFTAPKFWQENSDGKIVETIRKGHGAMPAFDLKPEEIQAIIDYMAHSFKKGGR